MKFTQILSLFAVLETGVLGWARFNGLCYNPKRADGSCPNVDQVKEDLEVLSKYTGLLKLYSVSDCHQGEPVLRAMENTNWKAYLGVWVGTDDAAYDVDKNELLRLASVFNFTKQVSAVVVGSEALYRGDQSNEQLAAKITGMKQSLAAIGLADIPVTTAETWPYYNGAIVDAVDFVLVNGFPFWEGKTVEESGDVMFGHIYDVQKGANGKRVEIGETGWPTEGANYGASVPSIDNSLSYMNQFICRARKEEYKYFWFSAIDAPWASTQNASDVESHWGIVGSDYKTAKYPGLKWLNCDA